MLHRLARTFALLVSVTFNQCGTTEPEDKRYWIKLNPPTVDISQGRTVIVLANTNAVLRPGEQIFWQHSSFPGFYCLWSSDPKMFRVQIHGFEEGSDSVLVRLSYREGIAQYLPVRIRHVNAFQIILTADTNAINTGEGVGIAAQLRDSVGVPIGRFDLKWQISDTVVAELFVSSQSACTGSIQAGVFGRQPGQVAVSATADGRQSNILLITINP